MKFRSASCFYVLFYTCIGIALGLTSSSPISAVESGYTITYGSKAQTIEGDNDFLQVFFIRIPSQLDDSLLLRIFDADCGGILDERFGNTWEWNTTTRFRLYGGSGAFSSTDLKQPFPQEKEIHSGTLITEKIFSENKQLDNTWFSFAELHPDIAEAVAEYRYFKLVVEGIDGEDGNVYSIDVRPLSEPNGDGAGVEIFSYTPTVHLNKRGVFGELRFHVPEGAQGVVVHHFDLYGATTGLQTAFRKHIPIPASGQDEWGYSEIALEKEETGRLCAVRFMGGFEMPNDGAFYITDANNRLLEIQLPFLIYPPNREPDPIVDIQPLKDCNTISFDASKTTDPDNDPLEFHWEFGDGAHGEGASTTHRYAAPGRYEAVLLIDDAPDLIYHRTIRTYDVVVNHPPRAVIGAETLAAPGQSIVFNGSVSTDPDGRIKYYRWYFGDGKKGYGKIARHAFTAPGVYTVALKVIDNSGTTCNTDITQCQVKVNHPPVIQIDDHRIASPGKPIVFSAGDCIDRDGYIESYEWRFMDGTVKNGVSIEHIFQEPGVYTVTLTITDDSNVKNAKARKVITVKVNTPPVAVAGKDRWVSVNEAVTLDASNSYDTDGKIIRYEWHIPGDIEITGKTVVHRFDRPGRYPVQLRVTDDSGAELNYGEDDVVINVNHPPKAELDIQRMKNGSEMVFDAGNASDPDGRIIKYVWDFGDGETSNDRTVRHLYRNPGVYPVSLTVIDDSNTATNTDRTSATVKINHLPIADAGPDLVGAPGQTLHFDGSGSVDPDGEIVSYHWRFGDGVETSGKTVNHSYTHPGTYAVLLTVQDDSGEENAVGFDESTVTINESPVAVIRAPRLVAPDTEVVLDGRTSNDPDGKIVSYHWVFSDKEQSFDSPAVKRKFETPGIYSAVLTVIDDSQASNSSAQDKVVIRVNHSPTANAGKSIHTSDRRVVLDGSASSDADGDVLTYTWDFGDGSSFGKGEKVFHTYDRAGVYPVILTVDDGLGLENSTAIASTTVKINDPPIADAGNNRTVCAGEVVIFDGSRSIDPEGGLMKFHWDFGDGTTADTVNPTKTYIEGGIYPVTLTVTDDSGLAEGSVSTDQIIVNVAESPVAEAGPDQTVCAGSIVRFDGSASTDVDGLVNGYSWEFGDGDMGGGPTPVHVYSETGTYRVILKVTGDQIGNCDNTDTDDMIVTVLEAPAVTISCPQIAAQNEPVSFDSRLSVGDGVKIVKYEWAFGDGNSASGQTAEHTYEKPGKYIVELYLETDALTDCNHAEVQKQIIVNAKPEAVAGEDRLVGVNQVVIFDGSLSEDSDGVISEYQWDFGDGDTGKGVRVSHRYQSPGQYGVVLTVKDNTDISNNTDTDELTVVVNAAPQPVITCLPVICSGEEGIYSAKDSVDPDGAIRNYIWNFGDGHTAEGVEVRHAYTSPRKYAVILEVDDGTNLNNSRVQTSTVITVNHPPTAHIDSGKLVSPGEKTRISGAGSKDRDGSIIDYQWTIGENIVRNGKTIDQAFETPGHYRIRLMVTDNSETACNTAEAVSYLRVNAPPVADAGEDRKVYIGGANDVVVFDGTASYDPDNDPLTYKWFFGDGNEAKGPKVFHSYKKSGKYNVKLRVDDGTGLKSGVDWATIMVTVYER